VWYVITVLLVVVSFLIGGSVGFSANEVDDPEHDIHLSIEEADKEVVLSFSKTDHDDVLALWQILQGDNLDIDAASLPISLGETIEEEEPTYRIDIPRIKTKCPECGEYSYQSH
jgi:hypothetical protein